MTRKMTRREINKTIKEWYNSPRNSTLQVILYRSDGDVMKIFEFGRNQFISDGRQSACLKRHMDYLKQADTFDLVEIPGYMRGCDCKIKIYGKKLDK